MTKKIRVTGGVIDSFARESRDHAVKLLKIYSDLDFEDFDDDYIELLGHMNTLTKAYVAVYDEAERIEKLTVAREKKIAEQQEEINRLKKAVHRENHAVRRNFVARFWHWLYP